MNLNNLTVLITGGSSGIGLAFAEALLEYNNRVVICGRTHDKLEKARQQLPQLDCQICDITQKGDVVALAAHLRREYGKLDLLINNAGVQQAIVLNDGEDHWSDIAAEFDINLVAQVQLTQLLLKLLTHKGGDSAIVNITSALAVTPKRSAPIYCSAKAGMHNFTRTLRYQLHGTSVRVFEVIPALVDTAMTSDRPSQGKISPQRLVSDALRGMMRDHKTIPIERSRLLLLLHRIFPTVAYRILRDQ
ncbi:MAG: SDR family oxidoreductase [Pseudomonadota bacterium]